jgi:trehalose synthase
VKSGALASTLQRVEVGRASLDTYRRTAGHEIIDAIVQLADALKGVRLLHLNSTASGGGVAELLNSLVPLEVDCGLNVEWRLLCPDEELFKVTKGFHNALQGQHLALTIADKTTYLAQNQHCAQMLPTGAYDVAVVHDPQPAAIPSYAPSISSAWVWRCHIDSSDPDPRVWNFLRHYVQQYDAAVFTMEQFIPPGLSIPSLYFIPPAIDPLSPKNRSLPKYLCREEVAQFGVDLARPLIIQVARFDPWKDPQGVIEAYRLIKKELPQTQLALIGSMAADDPQGWEIYNVIQAEARADPDVHILTNLNGVGAHEVNAFQRVADVVIQKSIREGFGLVVSEAVWKGTPVVGGNTGGIPLQIRDRVGGFLANSVEECAERVLFLLTHSDEAEDIARAGWTHVRDHFLTPRLLRDELQLIRALVEKAESARSTTNNQVATG